MENLIYIFLTLIAFVLCAKWVRHLFRPYDDMFSDYRNLHRGGMRNFNRRLLKMRIAALTLQTILSALFLFLICK